MSEYEIPPPTWIGVDLAAEGTDLTVVRCCCGHSMVLVGNRPWSCDGCGRRLQLDNATHKP